jgi:hypothetical protein
MYIQRRQARAPPFEGGGDRRCLVLSDVSVGVSRLKQWLNLLTVGTRGENGRRNGIEALSDFSRVAAGNGTSDDHDHQLNGGDYTDNDHHPLVALVNITSQGVSAKGITILYVVIMQQVGLADSSDIILLACRQKNQVCDRESGRDQGHCPPEDREVLGERVFLDKDGSKTRDTEEKEDGSSDIGSNLGDFICHSNPVDTPETSSSESKSKNREQANPQAEWDAETAITTLCWRHCGDFELEEGRGE